MDVSSVNGFGTYCNVGMDVLFRTEIAGASCLEQVANKCLYISLDKVVFLKNHESGKKIYAERPIKRVAASERPIFLQMACKVAGYASFLVGSFLKLLACTSADMRNRNFELICLRVEEQEESIHLISRLARENELKLANTTPLEGDVGKRIIAFFDDISSLKNLRLVAKEFATSSYLCNKLVEVYSAQLYPALWKKAIPVERWATVPVYKISSRVAVTSRSPLESIQASVLGKYGVVQGTKFGKPFVMVRYGDDQVALWVKEKDQWVNGHALVDQHKKGQLISDTSAFTSFLLDHFH